VSRLRIVVALLISTVALRAQDLQPAPAGEWRAYHGDNRSLRYSELAQITRDNVSNLRLAWERDLGAIGPKPEFKNEAAPLYVDGTLYLTAGLNRDVVALDPASGVERWRWSLEEGARAARAPRRNSGRGVSYWADGKDTRIVVVTPGFRLVSLDARSGRLVQGFGSDGIVDLKRALGRGEFDPLAPIGSSSPVVISNGVIVVGPALELGFRPPSMANVPGFVRGFDVRSGKELWRFNTIPQAGERYNETWERDSWKYTGNAGVWAPFSADDALGMCIWESKRRQAISTAATGSVTTCTRRAWCASTSAPARWCGTSSRFITISGTTTTPRRRC
jgi:quinoprotein glucose dehydrogenase